MLIDEYNSYLNVRSDEENEYMDGFAVKRINDGLSRLLGLWELKRFVWFIIGVNYID